MKQDKTRKQREETERRKQRGKETFGGDTSRLERRRDGGVARACESPSQGVDEESTGGGRRIGIVVATYRLPTTTTYQLPTTDYRLRMRKGNVKEMIWYGRGSVNNYNKRIVTNTNDTNVDDNDNDDNNATTTLGLSTTYRNHRFAIPSIVSSILLLTRRQIRRS